MSVAAMLAGHLAVVGAALAVVLAGTLAPLVPALRGGDGVAVAGTYFAAFAGPLALAGLVLLAALPLASGPPTLRTLAPAAAGGVAGLGALVAGGGSLAPFPLALGGAAGAVAAGSTCTAIAAWRRGPGGRAGRPWAAVGAHLAHAGLGLLFVGVAGTATGRTETVTVEPGDVVEVLGREVAYGGVEVGDGPTDDASAVVATVGVDGRVLAPSLVAYRGRGTLLAETSLVSTPRADVQVALRDARDDGTAVLQVGVHPLQVWAWWGGLALTAGAVLALAAPRRPAPAPSQPEPVTAARP